MQIFPPPPTQRLALGSVQVGNIVTGSDTQTDAVLACEPEPQKCGRFGLRITGRSPLSGPSFRFCLRHVGQKHVMLCLNSLTGEAFPGSDQTCDQQLASTHAMAQMAPNSILGKLLVAAKVLE